MYCTESKGTHRELHQCILEPNMSYSCIYWEGGDVGVLLGRNLLEVNCIQKKIIIQLKSPIEKTSEDGEVEVDERSSQSFGTRISPSLSPTNPPAPTNLPVANPTHTIIRDRTRGARVKEPARSD